MTIHQQIRERLAELYDEDDAYAWLQLPQGLLGGQIPAVMIAAGEGEKVRNMLQAILDGAFL